MTQEEIWNWQCKMYIYTSFLYYKRDLSIWKDSLYDQHCKFLLSNYKKLPKWFTKRVTEDDLRTGSGFTLDYSEEEIEKSLEWYNKLNS